mgnify:CR=1 FL=1
MMMHDANLTTVCLIKVDDATLEFEGVLLKTLQDPDITEAGMDISINVARR